MENKEIKIAILGGDLRQVKMASLLKSEGYQAVLYGFDDSQIEDTSLLTPSLKDAVVGANMVILGLPATMDGITLSAPLSSKKIKLDDIFKYLTPAQILSGGKITEKIKEVAREKNITCIDYLDREEFNVLNSVPTAEGAIGIAVEEMPITLHSSRALIIGYGRIGKSLAQMLSGMGTHVVCSARKCSDIAWIQSQGHCAVKTEEIAKEIHTYDVIFNTVPHVVLTKRELSLLKPDCLVIDLASKPGGVDFEAAKDLGVKVIWALSLPGKVAPVTAGEITKCAVINILDENLSHIC